MTERTTAYTQDQIGTGTARFPSGAPIPTASDLAVDPYHVTRPSKDVHVEGVMFWPQVKETFPGIVLLHDWWGLNVQIKETASRLAREGYVVLVPNLYGRQGGMVTASAELAEILMGRVKDKDALQDINSCCEYLNTRDHVKRNLHGVVGFGMGGSLAIQFACHRRRLRAAVSYCGRVGASSDFLKDLFCPLLYHRAGQDDWVAPEDVERLREAAEQFKKRIDIRAYDDAKHAFYDDVRKNVYHPTAARTSWEATIEFLGDCFKG